MFNLNLKPKFYEKLILVLKQALQCYFAIKLTNLRVLPESQRLFALWMKIKKRIFLSKNSIFFLQMALI